MARGKVQVLFLAQKVCKNGDFLVCCWGNACLKFLCSHECGWISLGPALKERTNCFVSVKTLFFYIRERDKTNKETKNKPTISADLSAVFFVAKRLIVMNCCSCMITKCIKG